MNLKTQKQQAIDDLDFIVTDNPTAYVFSSRTFNGTRASSSRAERADLGGFEVDFDLALIIRLHSDFTAAAVTAPANGDTITVNSINYEVARIQDDEFGIARRLDLRSLAR